MPFLWGKGEGNSNFYIGFLGYEIRRDGHIRRRKSNIERFDEKFVRLRYSLSRYRKNHTEEEYASYRQKKLDKAMKDVEVYKALITQRDKKLLTTVNNAYNILYLSMTYDGVQSKKSVT